MRSIPWASSDHRYNNGLHKTVKQELFTTWEFHEFSPYPNELNHECSPIFIKDGENSQIFTWRKFSQISRYSRNSRIFPAREYFLLYSSLPKSVSRHLVEPRWEPQGRQNAHWTTSIFCQRHSCAAFSSWRFKIDLTHLCPWKMYCTQFGHFGKFSIKLYLENIFKIILKKIAHFASFLDRYIYVPACFHPLSDIGELPYCQMLFTWG